MKLNDDIRGFFANYCRSFEAFDAHALSGFFSYPVLFTSADSVPPQTVIASASDYVSAIRPLVQAYRDLSVQTGRVVNLNTVVLASSLVIAVVDWEVVDSHGDILYCHQASYTLVRVDGWQIAAIALDELLKLRTALRARRSARTPVR